MYVIYPCDELVSGLIAREHSPLEQDQNPQRRGVGNRHQNLNLVQEEEDHPDFLSTRSRNLLPGSREDKLFPSTLSTPPPVEAWLPKKSAEIEKIRPDPVRPPRAGRNSANIHSTDQSDIAPAPGTPPTSTKRQKPKRSVSFTAAFRSRSKSKDKDKPETNTGFFSNGGASGSSNSLSKVTPTPTQLVPKPGFFGSGSWKFGSKDKQQISTDNNPPPQQNAISCSTLLRKRGGNLSVPRITFALEEEDHTFANYRGQNFHTPTTPAPGAVATPNLKSGGGLLTKRPPLPKLALTSNNSTQNHITGPATAAATTTTPPFPPAPTSAPSSRGGSVPRSLILSASNNSTCPPGGAVSRERTPQQQQKEATPWINSRTKNSPFTREAISAPQNLNRMAGLNGGGGSMSGSLMTLGVGASGHGGHSVAYAAASGGAVLDANSFKDCAHPSMNENLKAHNALSFQVIRIVSDFTQQLSQLHEQHAVQLQMLVENFRKRNAELRKEKPPGSSALFQIWETLLQEVEIDSQVHSDISGSFGRQIARPLLEKTFCLKIQSRKVFAHRESFETVLSKAESLLASAYRDYNDACLQHIQGGNNATLANYYDAHNAYVQQLKGTNAMYREYHNETLPALLQELEEVYVDLVNTLSESILLGSEIVSGRAQESNRRYETLASVCRNVNGGQDLKEYVKGMVIPAAPPPAKHCFQLPLPIIQASESGDPQDLSHVPILKEEVIMERQAAVSARNRLEGLRKEIASMESEMKQLQDSMDTLIRMQERSLDSNLWNKANELQEEISMKRFDLRVAQMHYAALKSQKELYAPSSSSAGGRSGEAMPSSSKSSNSASRANAMVEGAGGGGDDSAGYGPGGKGGSDRKFPGAGSGTGMKSKWLKAFKSLKSTPEKEPEKPPIPIEVLPSRKPQFQMFTAVNAIMALRKNGKEKDSKEPFQIFENHIFQEYTYKKITPCDICSQILRGHTRQGLRCRMCKMNVHLDCQEKVGKCQPKTRLLRRQRSTSELETRLTQLAEQQQTDDDPDGANDFDSTYQVLKEANVLKKPGGGGGGGGGSSGSGSGNGLHGSNQTLHSQHEMTPARIGRSNPSVNVISGGSSAHSGPSTPVHPSVAAASASGGISASALSQRRDSYLSRKSISADAEGSSSARQNLINFPPRSVSLTASPMPHSPRRRKLDLRMKSFSLDSPESTEHAQRRRFAHAGSQSSTSHSQSLSRGPGPSAGYANGGGSGGTLNNRNLIIGNGMVHSNSASSSNNYAQSSADFYAQTPFASLNHFAPSSPVHNRRALLSARNVRMSSVELPDENDKSISSASTSPSPSPLKPHRLLPTNLYVCLYMFKARHPDELDLKAGNRVTVVDTTDPDWWQGKCMGRVGYFPSKYVTKLHTGEKPLQVTHNLQVTDGADNGLKLLRDQIVIQIGEELDGMVTIRNGDNKQGICPVKYLQEV
ncbi:uncharacterized protein LOC110853970 isoform X3 [Folsomia candida]|uniref:uncharacterized protein LOC110853970 isoform X3 n=1 Tax=Folsomia candida TaxID=158441 RepID=UPI001604A64C|nr:uncharacterized protein LOC110853970 isoform X3 [Folsomia candida]